MAPDDSGDVARRQILHTLFRIVDTHMGRFETYRLCLDLAPNAMSSADEALHAGLCAFFERSSGEDRARAWRFLTNEGRSRSEGYLLGAVADAFWGSAPWGRALVHFIEDVYLHPPPEPVFLEMVVVSAVSTFEALLSVLVRASYHLSPESLLADSRRGRKARQEFSLERILDLGSVERVKQEAINRRTRARLGGGIERQRAFFLRRSKVDMEKLAMDWSAVREAIMRRHAIVHNAGLATDDYVRETPSALLDEPLHVTADYAADVIDELSVLGLLLAVSVMRKSPSKVAIPRTGWRRRRYRQWSGSGGGSSNTSSGRCSTLILKRRGVRRYIRSTIG